MFALRQADTGVVVAEGCPKRGISEATYDNWKKKYGGLGVPNATPTEVWDSRGKGTME